MSHRVFAHTADTGIEASGVSPEEVLEQTAEGMFGLMFEPTEQPPSIALQVRVSGDTMEDLLVEWLSELLYLSESQEVAFTDFSVTRVSDGSLEGSASGIAYETAKLLGPPIKAVTYHQLEVAETAAGWTARVIFDV